MLLFIFFNFIIFGVCWVFVAVCGLSLVVASGGYSSVVHRLLVAENGSRYVGSVVLWHVGSSWLFSLPGVAIAVSTN